MRTFCGNSSDNRHGSPSRDKEAVVRSGEVSICYTAVKEIVAG